MIRIFTDIYKNRGKEYYNFAVQGNICTNGQKYLQGINEGLPFRTFEVFGLPTSDILHL